MKVLVWISYGSVDVYVAEGTSDFERIKEEITTCSENYNDAGKNWLESCNTIYDLKSWVDQYTHDDDNFEYFEFTEVKV